MLFRLSVILLTLSGLTGHSLLAEEPVNDLLNQKMKLLDGKEKPLKDYRGKVLLVVNVASQCGLTPQYAELQKLHEKYKGEGLAIVGFPCNQFGKQEPGTASEIREFCQANYGVTFDMFSKIDVNGDKACELYKTLTALDLQPTGKGNISWNFEKFLIGRDGKPIARFAPRTRPSDEGLVKAIEAELAKPTAEEP